MAKPYTLSEPVKIIARRTGSVEFEIGGVTYAAFSCDGSCVQLRPYVGYGEPSKEIRDLGRRLVGYAPRKREKVA